MSRVLDMWAGMTGTVLDFAGTTAPTGWLMCYGQSLLRTDYPNLFDAIGTTYGAADGTHFTLPDCRGRSSIGKDNMGGTAANRVTTAGGGIDGVTLGAVGGAQTHQLTAAQMPSHTHANTLTDPGHTHTNTLTDPGHTHSSNAAINGGGSSTGGGGFALNATGGATINSNTTGITINNASKVTGMSINNVSQGSDGAHPNVQPGIVFNKIIKA
ncbi:phage tail protein [Bradyrhizobium sp. BWC-3-1]|uniref:phage tail protein n=1 Tax=Bradyrhizobium sp. BWC-3-1 TaxID=3080012 RepID=UPI00293F2C68|nr:tail fiber protein [Bradyrhizobium sp. BWC-3-1]WOH61899.1 tail fiber protein [Bradyrhizobium sp. BWC-3-1]